MTTTGIVMAVLALIVSIANPWLVARSNRKHQIALQAHPTPRQLIAKLRRHALVGMAGDFGMLLIAAVFFFGFLFGDGPPPRYQIVLAVVYVLIVLAAIKNVRTHWGWFKESFAYEAKIT
jgi:cell division protein FtsW (lipid II flippase)